MDYTKNRRILVVDDNPAIHEDFKKTLGEPGRVSERFADAESALFDQAPQPAAPELESYAIDSAFQGEQALEKVRAALAEGRPYAMAFVDVRMPPGWDGVETIANLWKADERLQAVICTAFADYSWDEMLARLGRSDRLLILKKPFDAIEVRQLACALTEKWNVALRETLHLAEVRRAELEARAYAASLETVNQALDTSRRAAEAESKTKSELLLRMTRNLFPPVGQLLDGAERARDLGPSGEDWLACVSDLCRDGAELRSSLQDLLDLSELEAGTLRTDTSPFSPREIVHEVVGQLAPRANERRLALEITCSPTLPQRLSSDRSRVQRILAHLVRNAIEHTAPGVVRVHATTRPASDGAPLFCIEVEDSGPGLSRDQQSFLFEPFCHAASAEDGATGQASDSRRRFGLGLSVSKRLAQRLGGDLSVESAPGQGSRFVVTLRDLAPLSERSRS